MKRTRTPERGAGPLERDGFADDADDVRRLAHALDFLVRNQSSTTVTPCRLVEPPGRKPRTRVSFRSISATRSRSAPFLAMNDAERPEVSADRGVDRLHHQIVNVSCADAANVNLRRHVQVRLIDVLRRRRGTA
jgi:hypothetical protein